YGPFLPPSVEERLDKLNEAYAHAAAHLPDPETLRRKLQEARRARAVKHQRGRRKTWTDERVCDLVADLDLLRLDHSEKSTSWLCRQLVRSDNYRAAKHQTLRRRWHAARRATDNTLLRDYVTGVLSGLRERLLSGLRERLAEMEKNS